jgi:methylglutaconyl-CoA hydratase
MLSELVRYGTGNGIATITLQSEHNGNALSARLVSELGERIESAENDDSVAVVVLRADGPTFCSGMDLAEAIGGSTEDAACRLASLLRRMVNLSKPVVARVQGAVRAGGIGVVAASDIAIVADNSTFALPEVRLGLTPAVISLVLLPQMIGAAAARTFLTGEAFDGVDAVAYGLAATAVSSDQLDDAVAETCASLLQGHPQGLRETKKVLRRHLVASIDEGEASMAALSARLFASDETRSAMTAFLHRRRSIPAVQRIPTSTADVP